MMNSIPIPYTNFMIYIKIYRYHDAWIDYDIWSYLNSQYDLTKEWKVIKNAVINLNKINNNGLCNCCWKKKATVVHHLSYDRHGEEDPSDLIPLCRGCHDRIHKRGKYSNKNKGLKGFCDGIGSNDDTLASACVNCKDLWQPYCRRRIRYMCPPPGLNTLIIKYCYLFLTSCITIGYIICK